MVWTFKHILKGFFSSEEHVSFSTFESGPQLQLNFTRHKSEEPHEEQYEEALWKMTKATLRESNMQHTTAIYCVAHFGLIDKYVSRFFDPEYRNEYELPLLHYRLRYIDKQNK